MQTKRKNMTPGFWRRFAAQWIDVFVIYSISKLIVTLTSFLDLRISFETLFIIIAAIYSTILLSTQRQTIGKMLLQIRIISKNNEPINFRNIMLREVFGKWGISVLFPLMIGRILAGSGWLPTVFDLLMLIPVMLLCIIYFLITKNMWYEHLAGLSVERNIQRSTVKVGFYMLMISAILGITTALTEYLILGRLPSRMAAFQNNNSTKPYVNFLV